VRFNALPFPHYYVIILCTYTCKPCNLPHLAKKQCKVSKQRRVTGDYNWTAREPRLLGLKYNGIYMCRCDQHNGTYEPQYKIESNQHVADELFVKEDQK